MTYIYGLFDPRNEELRYIGATKHPSNRLASHICHTQNTHKSHWISSLTRIGLKPEMVILENVDENTWKREERWWISYTKSIGAKLTNATDGGDGMLSAEARAKISAWNKGKVISEETKEKIRAKLIGNKHTLGHITSDETKEKLRIANIGRKRSDETKMKLRIASTGKRHSKETREKISKLQVGTKRTPLSLETRLKLSLAMKGRPSPLRGRKLPQKTKDKISQSAMGNKRWLGRKHTIETRMKISESVKRAKRNPCRNRNK